MKYFCCTLEQRMTLVYWVINWNSCFYLQNSFYLKEWLTNYSYSSRHFHEEQSEFVISRKTIDNTFINDKTQVSKQKIEFGKTCISFLIFNVFSGESGVILTNVVLKILYNEMCPHLEDLQTQWASISQMTTAWCYKINQ